VTHGTVTVIIVSHDSEAVIAGALDSLPGECPVICVDNDSRDRTREIVARYPVRLFRRSNIGFGRACNLGAEEAATEFLLFVNPDVRLAANAVDRLIDAARCYGGDAVFAPLVEDTAGQIQFREVSRIERWREPGRAARAVPVGDCCTGFIDGSVFLVRRESFLRLGGFDPSIFLYYEDDDLSWRLRLEKIPMIHVNAARATHILSSSSPATAANLMFRAKARKISEYYVKAKYDRRTRPLLDGLHQVVNTLWYGASFNRPRLYAAIGRLSGILEVLSSGNAPPSSRPDMPDGRRDATLVPGE
jgi:GT2 family glycosyltransferase